MGKKRKRDKSEDEIRDKIRRLEKELYSRKNLSPNPTPPPISHEYAYEDPGEDLYEYYKDHDGVLSEAAEELQAPLEETTGPNTNYAAEELQDPLQAPLEGTTGPTTSDIAEKQQALLEGAAGPNTMLKENEENTIPPEILAVLGEAKNPEEKLGSQIPTQISERWGKILVEGLVKEQKEALLTQMLIPENFTLAKAPKLNPEIISVLNEAVKNRDKRLEKMQNQLGSSISGIAQLTSELLNKDVRKIDMIKKLSEINQILLDLHFEETMNRRRLIIPILDKSFINIIQGVKRDKFLFGDNLGENIKTTKSIERSSLQIKKQVLSTQPAMSRGPGASNMQGNFRAPPRQASGPGATRAPPPHARYYQAQPPPPPHSRRPPPPPPPPPAPRRPLQSSARPQDRRNRR